MTCQGPLKLLKNHRLSRPEIAMVNDASFICNVQIHGFNGCDISGVSQLILTVCFIATVEEADWAKFRKLSITVPLKWLNNTEHGQEFHFISMEAFEVLSSIS